MTKYFQEQKKNYYGAILGTFFLEKGLSQLLNVPNIYHRAKNHEKLIAHY